MQQMHPCVSCGHENFQDKKFIIVIPEDFETMAVRSAQLWFPTLHAFWLKLANCCFLIIFSQIIPCYARQDFLDHVNKHINHEGQFKVTLVQETVPNKTYKVLVINESNRTYFTGPRWTELVERYGMDAGMRFRIYLDNTHGVIYFSYEIPDNSESSDFEDHSLN